jgi:hypothetical protein
MTMLMRLQLLLRCTETLKSGVAGPLSAGSTETDKSCQEGQRYSALLKTFENESPAMRQLWVVRIISLLEETDLLAKF